jgi:hypothetical protein
MFRKIYIFSKFALLKREMENWYPLLESNHCRKKLDIDSEESDLHTLNIICYTDKYNDDFCVDFMDEEDNWREVFLLSEREC